MKELPTNWKTKLNENNLPAYATCKPTENCWKAPSATIQNPTKIPAELKTHPLLKTKWTEFLPGGTLLLISILFLPNYILSLTTAILGLLLFRGVSRKCHNLSITLHWPTEAFFQPTVEDSPFSPASLSKIYFLSINNPEQKLKHLRVVFPTENNWKKLECEIQVGKLTTITEENNEPTIPTFAWIVDEDDKPLETIETLFAQPEKH
jgi:hypothetical protein